MRNMMMAGAALLVVGAIALVALLVSIPEVEQTATAGGQVDGRQGPPVGWSILIGLTLAAGGALFGIGMNRWRQGSPRTIQRPPTH